MASANITAPTAHSNVIPLFPSRAAAPGSTRRDFGASITARARETGRKVSITAFADAMMIALALDRLAEMAGPDGDDVRDMAMRALAGLTDGGVYA